MRARRVIEINGSVFGPPPPRQRTVKPRKRTDFPDVPAVYLDAAERLSSPLLMGPPLCDELLAFVRHLLTEEEASIFRHLGSMTGKSAARVAREEHRPPHEVEPILKRLAFEKQIIGASGVGEKARYRLMPLMPGIFEMALIGEDPENLSPWHRRLIELFEPLFETGYSLEYMSRRSAFVRYLPVGKSIEASPMALPTDKLEMLLDRFDVFAVGNCQCRMSARALGHGCGKPTGNCAVIGDWAKQGIEHGILKPVSKQGLLEIKAEAESHGLVNWMINIDSTKGQNSCSCCGCCCKAMRLVNEFNAPSMIAPPHFVPRQDMSRCNACGKCALNCPMGAITVDRDAKTWNRRAERCVGCGLCAVACSTARALTMEPVPDWKMPYKSAFSMTMRTTPARLWGAWKIWRQRR